MMISKEKLKREKFFMKNKELADPKG